MDSHIRNEEGDQLGGDVVERGVESLRFGRQGAIRVMQNPFRALEHVERMLIIQTEVMPA